MCLSVCSRKNASQSLWTMSSSILFYSILFYPITLEGRRGTTDEFATIPFHLVLFSAALVELAKSIPVHTLILSSHLFFCLPLFLFPLTVPCRIVIAKPEDLEKWPNHLVQTRKSKYMYKCNLENKLIQQNILGWQHFKCFLLSYILRMCKSLFFLLVIFFFCFILFIIIFIFAAMMNNNDKIMMISRISLIIYCLLILSILSFSS